MAGNARSALLPVAAMAILGGCGVDVNWKPATARTLTYTVSTEFPRPVQKLQQRLVLQFSGGDRVNVSENGTAAGSFSTTPAGSLILQPGDHPPYLAALLSSMLPAQPLRARVGSSWESVFPPDAAITRESPKISGQDRLRVRVTAIRGSEADLDVKGESIVKSAQLSSRYAAAVPHWFQWSPVLTGTAVYDEQKNAIIKADLFYVMLASAGVGFDQIRPHPSRFHTIITLEP